MLELSQFAVAAADASTLNTVYQVSVPGFRRTLPVTFLHRHPQGVRRSPLILCFHGAIDRSKGRIPRFEGRFLPMNGLAGEATVLSIADPSLVAHAELRTTWYAGEEINDTPAQIATFVAQLVMDLQPTRLVFVGGSTGAHPALLHSLKVPGSVAVVENPILHILAYSKRHITQYRQHCWPGLDLEAPFPASVNDNLATAYTGRGANTVVLLNNARDPHFWKQGYLLLQAMRRGDGRDRCLLYSDFFAEHPGHSFPAAVWARWVIAACRAPSCNVADIGASLPTATAPPPRLQPSTSPMPPAPVPRDSPPSDADIAAAQRVYAALMAQDPAA